MLHKPISEILMHSFCKLLDEEDQELKPIHVDFPQFDSQYLVVRFEEDVVDEFHLFPT
jgi:hypothetical protein